MPGTRFPAGRAIHVDRFAMPVEKTDRYWLMVNARRARALGIAIPPALRLRADEVIE